MQMWVGSRIKSIYSVNCRGGSGDQSDIRNAFMRPLPAEPTFLLQSGFVAVGVLLVVMFAVAQKSWVVLIAGAAWLLLTGMLARSGLLADFSSTPPRIALLLFPAILLAVFLGFSKFGTRLALMSLTFLIGFQAFRIAVELLIHRAAQEGIAPPQMTWTGLNWDILSGISALLLFPFARRIPRWGILTWNGLALALLLWIVGVAVLSFPGAFQRLKPDNVWVAYFPFIWLPTVAVTSALLGHVALFRRLLGTDGRAQQDR